MASSLSESVIIAPDPAALAVTAADHVVRILAGAVSQRGAASLAISGGTTPTLYFPLLASEPLPWDRIALFWADERCVPPSHEESNFGMADRLLLSRVHIPGENIHRIRGEKNPALAARDYTEELQRFFGGLPRFDLVILGVGSDGHTASLFPGDEALETEEHVSAVHVPRLNSSRITLTLPVLNHARAVLMIVSGNDKAPIVERLLDMRTRGEYPAGRVRPERGELIWLLDAAAADNIAHEY
jgi:6-phosphogluconolactonase